MNRPFDGRSLEGVIYNARTEFGAISKEFFAFSFQLSAFSFELWVENDAMPYACLRRSGYAQAGALRFKEQEAIHQAP